MLSYERTLPAAQIRNMIILVEWWCKPQRNESPSRIRIEIIAYMLYFNYTKFLIGSYVCVYIHSYINIGNI